MSYKLTNSELGHGHHGGLIGPDPQDSRDWLFGLSMHTIAGVAEAAGALPDTYLLPDAWMPPVRNQGQLGACVAWTYKGIREMLTLKVGHTLIPTQELSALWIYYEAREAYHPEWLLEDSGLYMRDGMGTLTGRGAALESRWPYHVADFAKKPTNITFKEAGWYKNINAYRISTTFELRSCLAAGWPVAFGFPVYENFYDAESNGIVPMPHGGVLGGHANWFTGYRRDSQAAGGIRYRTRNSWGPNFGDHGDLWFPENFIHRPDITVDMWALCLKSEPQFVDQPD